LEVKACLKWLACFHGKFLNVEPKGLWQIGTYWHLATRPDEYNRIDGINHLELKDKAFEIDDKLNSCTHQTIVHGDAKLANFCFAKGSDSVAALDFQYVGGGCGMKDVEWRSMYLFAIADFNRFLLGWMPTHQKLNTYNHKITQSVLRQLAT